MESTSEIVPTLSGYSEVFDFGLTETPLLLKFLAKYYFLLPLLIGRFDESFLWGLVLVIGLILPVPLSACLSSIDQKFGTFFEDRRLLPPTTRSNEGITLKPYKMTPEGFLWAYINFFFEMFLSISLKAIFVLSEELPDLEDDEELPSFSLNSSGFIFQVEPMGTLPRSPKSLSFLTKICKSSFFFLVSSLTYFICSSQAFLSFTFGFLMSRQFWRNLIIRSSKLFYSVLIRSYSLCRS